MGCRLEGHRIQLPGQSWRLETQQTWGRHKVYASGQVCVVNSRPGIVPHWAVLLAVVQADEVVLGELDVPQCCRLVCPPVDQVTQTVAKAGHFERTGLRVVRELPQVHLTLGSHRQPLGVGDSTIRSHPAYHCPDWKSSEKQEMSPDKSVWYRHFVQVRVLTIHEVSVWSPYPRQKLPVQN